MTQQEALDILKMGKNVYLTGSAGSGKTYLLNQYIKYLREHNVDVAVTASTGIAATHMSGVTIHSWSGLGIRDTLNEYDLDAMEQKPLYYKRFDRVKVLVIDEVSMLHHFRLDLVDRILRTFKRNDEPFGGIQVVLCGDFFQLPPVSRPGEQEAYFIYRSKAWKEMNPTICYLKEQHRQTDDACLEVLNDIRRNNVSESTYEHLEGRYKKPIKHAKGAGEKHTKPTRLFTHNVDVDRINNDELGKLVATSCSFEMSARGSKPLVELLKKSCLAPAQLMLKIGAQVMFVKNNYEAGYVNGTQGTVVGFEEGHPIVETLHGKRIVAEPMDWVIEEDGKVKAEICQVPLRLAWAITVHKSQGMSLDAVEVDLSRAFEKGMGYVALSRVRTLAGLSLLGINEMALQVHDEVLEFDRDLQDMSEDAAIELRGMEADEVKAKHAAFLKKVAGAKKAGNGSGGAKLSTYEVTRDLILKEISVAEMAAERDMTEGTIIDHIAEIAEKYPAVSLAYLKPEADRLKRIRWAFESVKVDGHGDKLAPVFKKLNGKGPIGVKGTEEPPFTYEEIRLGKVFLDK